MSYRAPFHLGFHLLTVSVLLGACGPTLPADDTVCGLTFSDQGDVRVFVVGHSFSLEDARSLEHFEASFREDMRRIAPCLSTVRPNLVVFPEDSGLVAWFAGRQALLARGSSDSTSAFNTMYAGYFRQTDEYRRRFPGISGARALTLALGDVGWRAMDRTFGGIAQRYGIYVITSANLPYVERRTDDDSVDRFRDPDAPEEDPAYVATRGECFNTALLYGPSGELLSRIDKIYLTDTEEDSLDLSNGPLETLGVFELPFARIGAAISRDAFYAPFLQRMEDLGVDFVVQPEAFSGWTIEQDEGDWLPDVILASGWTHTQKYRGFRHNATPMLTGNLFELVFDGQTWITQKAKPEQPERAFVGSQPLRGWLDLGPWTFPDPLETAPALSLQERQTRLREQGRRLAPGSGHESEGKYARTLIAADLVFPGRGPGPVIPVTPGAGVASRPVASEAQGHQTNPDAAYDAAGRLYVVFSDGRASQLQVYLTISDDDGRTFTAAKPLFPSDHAQLRPTVAAGPSGQVTVAWQEAVDEGAEQILTVSSTDGGATFSQPARVEATGSAQWEPDVAYQPGSSTVALVWTDFREGLAPKIRIARSADGGRTWEASSRVDPSNVRTARTEGSQLQPSVTWSSNGALAVTWIDYRERDWEVYAAVAAGATATLGPAEQISPEDDAETLASDPQLAPGPEGSLVLVWDDQRERRGHHDVRGARWSGGSWAPLPLLTGGADEGAFLSRFRPSVATVLGESLVVFQDLSPGKNGLAGVRFPQGSLPGAVSPARLDDTGSAANQLTRPRVVARQDFSTAVVLFEDDRDGYSRVRCTDPL
jgi:predicted amidohydrolase